MRRFGFVLTRVILGLGILYALSLKTRVWSGPTGRDLEHRCDAPASLFALFGAWIATGVFMETAGVVRELRGSVDRERPRQEWARTLGGFGLLLVAASFAAAPLVAIGVFDVSGALPLVLSGATGVIGGAWVLCAELVATLAARTEH